MMTAFFPNNDSTFFQKKNRKPCDIGNMVLVFFSGYFSGGCFCDVVYSFKVFQTNMLLLVMMTEFDEAFIVSILHNSFDRWAQEVAIIASGGKVDSKTLEKTKWTDTGSAAKKYEGWVEEGIEFFNDHVEE
jgi:hypothetical protein